MHFMHNRLPMAVAVVMMGRSNVISNNTLEGDGTVGDPMGLASQGATAGQVLKWNGNRLGALRRPQQWRVVVAGPLPR